MKVIAVVTQKGGAGKTTTAENLAAAAAEHRDGVVLVDLDSQPTATRWGDRRKDEKLTVVSAQFARLRHVLETAEQAGASFVVLDTPPETSAAALEAAKVADLVLVPTRPNINDMETLPALRQLLTVAGDRPTFVIINAAPSQGARHLEVKDARLVLERMGFAVCPVLLCNRVAYAYAPKAGKGVTEYEPGGKAAEETRKLYEFVCKQLNS